MKTEFTPSLSFNALLVNHQNIYHNGKNTSENTVPSSIVKIDRNNPNDIKALDRAVEEWGEGDIYGKDIVDSAKRLGAGKNSNTKKSTIYALTLQQNNFENLDGAKILGLSELITYGKKRAEINFLQVKPACAGKNEQKQYLNVGRSIINLFQRMHANKELLVKADYRAANFYEKMNFEIINPSKLLYKWTSLKGIRFAKH